VDDRRFYQIACGAHPASCPLDSGEIFIWTKAFGELSFVQRRGVYVQDLDLSFVRFLASYLIERGVDYIFYNVVADLWEVTLFLL
jgi:hypothetical protein